jgi:glutamine amidotransferase
MQIMARRSDEGALPGLGWIDAEVKKFDERTFAQKMPLPHMGWNDVLPRRRDCLFNAMETPRFYFLHSYYFHPVNPEDILAVTNYNGQFASAVRSANVFGTQFHPEKSHEWGIQLLKNFAEV